MCFYQNCRQKKSIIGFCKFCDNTFCGKHRLPESHECTNLRLLKDIEFNNNKQKLLNNICKNSKI